MDLNIFQMIIICLAFLMGALSAVGVGWMYLRSYPDAERSNRCFLHEEFLPLLHHSSNPQGVNAIVERWISASYDAQSDAFAKRQSFWTSYVQFILSITVVVFITVLLLLKIVTAEAGLPILAAFGGAAISQGVSSTSTAGSRNRPAPRPE